MRGIAERGRTILGEAGLGKSALVRRIAHLAQEGGDWVTPQLRIPSGGDPMKVVAQAVLDLANQAGLAVAREERVRNVVERVRAVAVAGLSITLDRHPGPEPFTALTALLTEIGARAADAGKAVLIHIDEVQNISGAQALSQLLIALGDALVYERTIVAPGGLQVRQALPIAVYLTGLPEFAETTVTCGGATFARRFATTVLEPIEQADLTMALSGFVLEGWELADDAGGTHRIRMSQEAAALIADLCCGEPFLFQLAGERAWFAGISDEITIDDVREGWATVRTEATAHVERILTRLPTKERRFLEAMAALPAEQRSATNIAKAMGLADASKVGQAAQRLDTMRGIVDRGKPYTFRHRAIEAYLTSSWPRVEA